MRKLISNIGGRKFVVTILGLVLLAGMVYTDTDIETIKWFGGIAVGIIGGYNVSNALAKSNGKSKK